MKKEYSKPVSEIEEIEALDVISTSSDLNKDDQYGIE